MRTKQAEPLAAPTDTLDLGDTMVLESKFTFADASRLTVESATWPLPVFPDGPGAAARKAIEANGFKCDEGWRGA